MDKQVYLTAGEQNYAMRAQVEKVADAVCEKGFRNIIFVGSGGSLMMLDSLRYLFFQKTDIPVYALSAAEVLTAESCQINQNSLVVILTLMGTKETGQVAAFCKERGIDTVAFVGVEGSPAGSLATYEIYNGERNTTLRYMMLLFFALRIMYKAGFFDGYDKFAKELKAFPETMWEIGAACADLARAYGQVAGKEDFLLWVASGVAYSETFRFATCTVEEMVRLKSQVVHSSEFFHGSFEIVGEEECVLLVKNLDGNRPLDDRVEAFLDRFNKKHFVLDMAKLPYGSFSKEFIPYLVSPAITTIFKGEFQPVLEEVTGRNINTRRYYGVVEY